MREIKLNTLTYLHLLLPLDLYVHMDAEVLRMLQGGAHTLLVKKLPPAASGTCALKYLAVSAAPCLEVPNTERQFVDVTLPEHIANLDLRAIVLAPGGAGALSDSVRGAWVCGGDAGADGAFADAVLVSERGPDLDRVHEDRLNCEIGLVVPFVCKPFVTATSELAARLERVFPGAVAADSSVHRQVLVRREVPPSVHGEAFVWSNIAGSIPNRNLLIHCDFGAPPAEPPHTAATGAAVHEWGVEEVLSFVQATLVKFGHGTLGKRLSWLARMREKNFAGGALVSATKFSLHDDFDVPWGTGKCICARVVHARLWGVDTSEPSGALVRFMCRLPAGMLADPRDGDNFVHVGVGEAQGGGAVLEVAGTGGRAVRSVEAALDVLLRPETMFTGGARELWLSGPHGLSRALGDVPLEDIVLVGACVEGGRAQSVRLVVCEHDGLDDEQGVVLERTKLAVSALPDGTPCVYAAVLVEQLVRVHLNNMSQANMTCSYDFVDDDGNPEGKQKDLELQPAETVTLQTFKCSREEVRGHKVCLSIGKRKATFVFLVATCKEEFERFKME